MTIEGANHPNPVPDTSNCVVVGHDGSAGADTALAAAMELADQLSLPVVLVRAWSIATAPRPAQWEFGYVSSFEEYADAVYDELERDSRTIVGLFPLVPVICHPAHAAPAKALIALSQNARLLVVGTRGLGGLAGMLLGSVSEQCVRHAACLVLVVPPQT
ncbi:universal stress protein [Cryobacterium aureum]|uniref:universal stress protein n=1 Tax=Cryobacterium aureum TaxID=995037 RepID=UPI001F0C95E4|nr:universal stress protein [Cryobacterium aureum]